MKRGALRRAGIMRKVRCGRKNKNEGKNKPQGLGRVAGSGWGRRRDKKKEHAPVDLFREFCRDTGDRPKCLSVRAVISTCFYVSRGSSQRVFTALFAITAELPGVFAAGRMAARWPCVNLIRMRKKTRSSGVRFRPGA